MSRRHVRKKKNTLLLMLLIVVVLIVVIVISCFIGRKVLNDGKGESSLVNEQTENKDGEKNVRTDDAIEYITINTDYGDLYYPEQWNDYLVTEQVKEGESLIVSFSASINDVQYPMFKVTIGNSEEAEVGELTDSSGTKRTVYMSVAEIEKSDALSSDEQQRLYAMQEDLNYLIDNLK